MGRIAVKHVIVYCFKRSLLLHHFVNAIFMELLALSLLYLCHSSSQECLMNKYLIEEMQYASGFCACSCIHKQSIRLFSHIGKTLLFYMLKSVKLGIFKYMIIYDYKNVIIFWIDF